MMNHENNATTSDTNNDTVPVVMTSVQQPANDDLSTTAMNSLTVTESTNNNNTATDMDDPHLHHTTSPSKTTIDNDTTKENIDTEKRATILDVNTTSIITTTGSFIPDPSSIPISLVRRYRIDTYDVDTNITVQLFQERHVVTCSQTTDGKITAWLLCQPIWNMYAMTRQLQWEVSHLLGGGSGKRDDTLLTVYCQRISTVLWERIQLTEGGDQVPSSSSSLAQHHHSPKTILFGFTLLNSNKNKTMPHGVDVSTTGRHEPELFHTIVDLVVNAILEASGRRPQVIPHRRSVLRDGNCLCESNVRRAGH